jgi:DNA-binding response OmpR family regulator
MIMTSSTGRILIVDGETTTQKLIRDALLEKGFQCDLAADGPEALKSLAKCDYDVVVTELLMQKMNGGEFVIRILGQLLPPAIVVHTNIREMEVFDGLKREGIKEIFLKPAPLAVVVERVQKLALARSQSPINCYRKELRKASRRIVPENIVRTLATCDEWIQNNAGRLHTFRFCILTTACILLGLSMGNSQNEHWSSICSMFGLSGLASFFCLELVAYYREQCRTPELATIRSPSLQ